MELFKKLLKEAVTQRAMRLQMQANALPSIVTAAGPIELKQFGNIESDLLWQIYQALFPKDQDSIRKQQPTKGVMNVVGVGHVLLIAEPAGTPTLKLYLPDGHNMFATAWADVDPSAQQSSKPSSEVPPPPARALPLSSNAAPASEPVVAAPAAEQPPPPVPDVTTTTPETKAASTLPAAEAQEPFVPQPIPDMFAVPDPIATEPTTNNATTATPSMFAIPDTPAAPIPAFVPAVVATIPANLSPSIDNTPPTPAMPIAAPVQPTVPTSVNVENTEYDIPFGDDPRKVAPVGMEHPINSLLRDMVKRKASDLHLTAGEPVAMRIDGEIIRVGTEPISIEQMKSWLLPIMPPASRQEFYLDSDTDFAYEVRDAARFRVNIYRDRNGVGAVMRQIPSQVLTADQLGLSDAIRRFCTLTKGLVLVTGPTGSGKSTTLAAMIDLINKTRHDHILTIEDPIEFVHQQQRCLVNQREVHRHTKSYARALRAALREDPDIVMIGEMRDLETVQIAIETAETGHLVFGTLHTNTAISTVDRIVDQFPTEQQAQIRVMMGESLKGVVSQTLLKKIGGGRVAAQEILVVNKAIASLLREGKTHMIANQMQSQKADGNVLLNDALINLVLKKLVTPHDAFVKAVDKDNFIAVAQQKGVDLSFLKKTEAA